MPGQTRYRTIEIEGPSRTAFPMTWEFSGCVGIVDPIAHHPPLRFLSADFRVAVGLNNILGIFEDSPALSRILLVTSEAASPQRSSTAQR